MAKEIKVTFDNGGIYEGFANTYTLDNTITYYFSFDRDYRVQTANNAITLQEYRNAGAWYPIDIITNFEIAEIGGTADATKQWVQDNFVLKSGDTMTGALKFDFGSGVVFRIEPNTALDTKRAKVTGNGAFYWENDDKKRTFSIVSYDGAGALNIYTVDNKRGAIWLRDHEAGTTGRYRSISFAAITNSVENNTAWLLSGVFKADANWFFNGQTYYYKSSFWRSSDGTINTYISNNGDIQLYNGKQLYVRKNGYGSSNDHFTTFKYNGQDTSSNISGEDARYRITGYNNFTNSIECYDKITIKTEGQNTARLILDKGSVYTYDASNKRRVNIATGVAIYGANDVLQYQINNTRFDIYHGNAVICHNGSGTNDVQATFQYNGIRTYNYDGLTFNVDITSGYYANTSKRFDATGNYVTILATASSGMNLSAPNGNVIISDSKGVYGRSSNEENNTYITNNTQNVYVQTSQTIPSDTRRDELTALLDLFQIVYNILETAGIPGASAIAQYTSDVVLWIYDNQSGVLKPTITKIRNLIHS